MSALGVALPSRGDGLVGTQGQCSRHDKCRGFSICSPYPELHYVPPNSYADCNPVSQNAALSGDGVSGEVMQSSGGLIQRDSRPCTKGGWTQMGRVPGRTPRGGRSPAARRRGGTGTRERPGRPLPPPSERRGPAALVWDPWRLQP